MSDGVEQPRLWIVREPEPLADYIRPRSRDIGHLTGMLAAGHGAPTGLVIDGRNVSDAAELRDAALMRGVDVIID